MPARGLAAHVGGHRGRLGRGDHFEPEVGELLRHLRGGQRLLHFGGEPGGQLARRAGRHHHALPSEHLGIADALLLERGHVGQRGQSPPACHAERHQPAGADMRQADRGVDHHHRHLVAEHVLHGRGRAAIRDVNDEGAGALLEQLEGEVMRAAGADRGIRQLARRVARGGKQIARRLVAGRRMRHQDQRKARHQPDRLQLRRVVGELRVKGAVEHQRGVVGRHHRVAVGRGALQLLCADRGGRAGAVVHDHRLTELRGQLRADRARQEVGTTAGRVGHQPADRLGRPGLRAQRGRRGRQR